MEALALKGEGLQRLGMGRPGSAPLSVSVSVSAPSSWSWSVKSMSMMLIGFQRLSSECPEVRQLISVAAAQLEASQESFDFDSHAVRQALLGLSSMRSDCPEVQRLVAVLARKVLGCRGVLPAEVLAAGLLGLRHMNCEHPEVAALVSALAAKSPRDSHSGHHLADMSSSGGDGDGEGEQLPPCDPVQQLYYSLLTQRKSAPS